MPHSSVHHGAAIHPTLLDHGLFSIVVAGCAAHDEASPHCRPPALTATDTDGFFPQILIPEREANPMIWEAGIAYHPCEVTVFSPPMDTAPSSG